MSGKLKILLAVLALGALISVSYGLSLFRSSKPADQTASLYAAGVDPCQQDTDKDGLSDCEETYWGTDYKNPDTDGDGFKDGEEVLSGHDPAKKGPDDLLNGRGNVTQEAATLMLGGIATGDLKPDSPKYNDSVQKLTDAVLERYQANSTVTDEDVAIGTDKPVDIIKYGFAASNIVGPALKDLGGGFAAVVSVIANTQLDDLSSLQKKDPEQYQKLLAAIDQQIGQLDRRISSLRKMTVPPSMVTGHKNVLILLRGTQQQYRLLRQVSLDPVQGTFAFQSLANLTRSVSVDVAEDFARRLNNAVDRTQ